MFSSGSSQPLASSGAVAAAPAKKDETGDADNAADASLTSSFATTTTAPLTNNIHQPPPPPINNYFHPPRNSNSGLINNVVAGVDNNNSNNNNNGNSSNNNGGLINVDNIFASMTADADASNNNSSSNNNNKNNIFQNFANTSTTTTSSSTIPFRNANYTTNINHNHNNRGGPTNLNNMMIMSSASTTATRRTHDASTGTGTGNHNSRYDNHNDRTLHRSGSGDGLSKSMGNPSFLLRSGVNRNKSESESDPTTSSIRYAGYLLKRSNLPYTGDHATFGMMLTSIDAAVNIESGIAPLPDLSQLDIIVNNDDNGLFTLPFGGFDDTLQDGVVGSSSDAFPSKGVLEPLILSPTDSSSFHPVIIDPTFVTSITTEDTVTSSDDAPCFCSPLIQFFDKLFQRPSSKTKDALVTTKSGSSSPPKTSMKVKSVSSPKPTKPLPITPNVGMSPVASSRRSPSTNRYTMPLKAPARSEPMPISPAGGRGLNNMKVTAPSQHIGGQLSSRSFSNGGKIMTSTVKTQPIAMGGTIATTATTSVTTGVAINTTPPKQYPPPPPNYIDPKDGHIWRAKYCILECGILYFYRTAEEGESNEAMNERYESRLYSEELEDIVLGEEVAFPTRMRTSSSGSPRATMLVPPANVTTMVEGSQRLLRNLSSMEDSQRSSSGRMDSGRMDSVRSIDFLSKSPMPLKKSDFFHRSMSNRSTSSNLANDRAASNMSTPERGLSLHHSSSTGTFHHDADILWEKRVSLDCVGAVRSCEQEYGCHAFELLAYGDGSADDQGDDNYDNMSRGTGRGSGSYCEGQNTNEIIDRLILRAGSSDDMNTWMFEFHRSLMSFMQQFVNSVRNGSGGNDAAATARGDLLAGMMAQRPDSPHRHQQHRRLPSGGGGIGSATTNALLSPFVTKSSFASSPTTYTGGGGGSFSPNIVGSLSHGHGRNALYRRQVRDRVSSYGDIPLNKGGGGSMGNNSHASVVSPLHTPAGTPVGGSSPVLLDVPTSKASLPVKPQQPSLMPTTGGLLMIQSDSSKMKNKELSSLKDLREGKEEEKNEPSPAVATATAAPSAAPAPAPSKKYIPPFLRRKLEAEARKLAEAASGGATTASGTSTADVTAKSTSTLENHVPLNDDIPKNKLQSEDADIISASSSDALSNSALSGASSLLTQQLEEDEEEEEDVATTSINVRLGGCADPTIVVGSITDHLYIHRKASVVGNAKLEAYGGMGGGFYASHGRKRTSKNYRQGRSEEEELMFLDNFDRESNINRWVLKWEVGASSECGIRNSNEDSYVVINDLDEVIRSAGLVSFSQQDLGQTKQQGLYAIFDGHVGNQAARFSAEKFPDILIEEQSVFASRDSASLSSIEERADYVLKQAFDRLDREFCSLCTKDGRDWDCGSTALAALIVDDVVSLANLGDCRGVVCRLVSDDFVRSYADTVNGWEALDVDQDHEEDPVWDRATGGGDDADASSSSRGKLIWKEITDTHSPLVDEERARIENANGWIIQETEILNQIKRLDIFDEDVVEIVSRCFKDRMKQHRSDPVRQLQIGRTCGDLAVSRAIGDRDFKMAYNNMPPLSSNIIIGNSIGGTDQLLARSWEGPPVFLYPDGHSRRFRGDIVSGTPDIKSFRVGQEGVVDEFLLMACDGLWDVMDGDDAVRIAKDLLFDKKMSAKDGASRLAELAQHLGSSDNITVILIRFYWEECKEE